MSAFSRWLMIGGCGIAAALLAVLVGASFRGPTPVPADQVIQAPSSVLANRVNLEHTLAPVDLVIRVPTPVPVDQMPTATPGSPQAWLELAAIAGGATFNLVADEDVVTLGTLRRAMPVDLRDPAVPRLAGEPELFPWLLGGLVARDGISFALPSAALARRDPADPVNPGWHQVWRLEQGRPVPAANAGNSFDYPRRILLPADRPELVVLLTRGGLRVLTAAEPVRELGYVPRLSEQHVTYAAAYGGGRVYWLESAADHMVLRTVSLADPALLAEGLPLRLDLASSSTAPNIWHLAAAENRLYLASWAELRVFDVAGPVADPAGAVRAPVPLGQGPLGRTVWALLPDGDALWLLVRDAVLEDPELTRVDVRDPARPAVAKETLEIPMPYRVPEHFAWTTPNFDLELGLTKRGDHLLIQGGRGGGLRVVDVADPAAPRLVGRLDTLGTCSALVIAEGFGYCSVGDGLIPVADREGRPVQALDPDAPRESLEAPPAVAFEGGIAHLDPEKDILRSFATDPPALPREQGRIVVKDGYALAAVGKTAWVVVGEDGFQGRPDALWGIDLSDPAAPRHSGTLALPEESLFSSAVHDTTLFLASYDAVLLAVDVSDPAAPRIVGRLDGLPDIRPDIAALDGWIFVFSHEQGNPEIITVDGRDPSKMRIAARYTPPFVPYMPGNTIVRAVDPERRQLMVTSLQSGPPATALQLIDAADPTALAWLGSQTVGYTVDIGVAGDLIYLAEEDAGVTIWRRLPDPDPAVRHRIHLPEALRGPAQGPQ